MKARSSTKEKFTMTILIDTNTTEFPIDPNVSASKNTNLTPQGTDDNIYFSRNSSSSTSNSNLSISMTPEKEYKKSTSDTMTTPTKDFIHREKDRVSKHW